VHYDEWEVVAKFEQYIASGEPLDLHGTLTDAAAWERYQRGMRAVSALSADEVAARLPVPKGATALLDIGGSHGFYSVSLCRRHAALQATILDLPAAVEQAAPILARENMGDRVRHRAGNALTDDLGENVWDVVFLSQLVHHFTDEQNRAVMRSIARALRPGGVCAVVEVLRPASPEQAGGMGAVLDLYFAATSRSGTWPLATMQSWQRDAGLQIESPIHLRTLPGGAMVIGRKA
jgi:SAM-dependent methyltransferase